MPYLKKADILDNVLNELLSGDEDAILDRADRQLESLAQTKGMRDFTIIGTDQGDTAGTILINGAGQTGKSIALDGFTASGGTIKQGATIRIAGLRLSYDTDADATISGNAVTLTLNDTLEQSPADNAAVSFRRLHETVFDWMVAYVNREVSKKHMFTGDDPDQDRDDDKYLAKYKIFKEEEETLRNSITKEMIDNEIDEITDVVGDGGQLFRA